MNNFIETAKPRLKRFRESLYLLSRNKLSLLALIILVLLALIAILAPYIAPHPEDFADAAHMSEKLLPPSAQHWMGTDELGRDIFSRVLYGTRVSLRAALCAVGLSLVIGIPLGAIAGSFGGWVDNVIMRITDVFLSFPPLLLAIAMVALMGSSLNNAVLAISLSWWPWYTRLVRGQAISVKERKFVQAAETIGTSRMKIIFKHIIPNCISPVIVQASMDIGGVILTVASLSFLGLGVKYPFASWGNIINDVNNAYVMTNYLFIWVPAGICLLITVLGFNFVGDGLRDAFDPKMKR